MATAAKPEHTARARITALIPVLPNAIVVMARSGLALAAKPDALQLVVPPWKMQA